MEHRGMRRIKRQVSDPGELKAIIGRASVLRIGYSDAEGMAIVPVSFGFEWDTSAAGTLPTFWLHCAGEGRKSDAWAKNPQVALELDADLGVITGDYACAYSLAFESIMANGRMTQVESNKDKAHGLARIMEHMAPGAPVQFSDEALERVAIWRVDVTSLSGKRRGA